MSTTEVEQILVVPTSRFRDLGYFQGFSNETGKYIDELLSIDHISYRPRPQMEVDPSFKQLIPYVIFRHIDESGLPHLFSYSRGQGQGEARLHDKWSIGIGGHISSVDSKESNPYLEGMKRELSEEVHIETDYTDQCVGLINDDETEVGRVHLGIVHIFDVNQPQVSAREDEICNAKFRNVTELLEMSDRFETWSQICLQALFA